MLFTPEEHETLAIFGEHFDFPTDYLVLDTETCGFSHNKDFVVDLGWALVENSKVKQQGSLLLDWSQYPHADHGYIKSQLIRLADIYNKEGRPFYYPWGRLCKEGMPPVEGLHQYITMIYDHIIKGGLLVGHGFWRFDRRMLDGHTKRFLQGYLLPWRLNSIFDTGLLEKAIQAGRPPYPEDTLDEWMRRVNNAQCRGVKWNMERHCAPKYRLAERYNLDMRLMHTACFDCVLIHHLLQTFQELTEATRGNSLSATDAGHTRGRQ